MKKINIKSCSGSCEQGRRECDCEQLKEYKDREVINTFLIILFACMFLLGMFWEKF